MEPYYKIATVSSSREAGTYINAFSVKLDNALSKADIYYATDGTTPSLCSTYRFLTYIINKEI